MDVRTLTSVDRSLLSKAAALRSQLPAQSKKVNKDPIIKIRDRDFARLFLIHEKTVPQMNLDNADVWKRRRL